MKGFSKNKFQLFFIVLVLCIFTHFLSYGEIDPTRIGQIQKVIYLIFMSYIFLGNGPRNWNRHAFSSSVMVLMLFPLFSVIPGYLFHHQSIIASVYALWGYFGPLLFYFYLHKTRPNPGALLKILLSFAVIWSLLELIQQFTYPAYWFYTRGDDALSTGIEIRNGVYRFNILPWGFALISAMYAWSRLLNDKVTLKYILILAISLAGIYLYVSRTVTLATAAGLFILLMLTKGKAKKLKLKIIGVFVLIGVALNVQYLFPDFVETTQSQYENLDDDIRMAATLYYGVEYFENWVCNLLGNGIPTPFSAYGEHIATMQEDYGLWRVDIGLVGDYNEYGIIYVLGVLWVFFRAYKVRAFLDNYQKVIFVCILACSYIIPPFNCERQQLIIYAMFFYLCDISIERNRLAASNFERAHR